MIDKDNYTVIDNQGYISKKEAYDVINTCYSHIKGVTTYFDNGLWYIVISKFLS